MSQNNTTPPHNNLIQKNRVYAPIIIGLSILLVVLVLYPIYTSYIDTSIEVAKNEQIKAEKQNKINEIKAMQAQFASSGSSELKDKVRKYNHSFNTSDIMEAVMVNKYTKSSTLTPAAITIGSFSVDKGKKLPSGLSLANVSITVTGDTPDQIIDYITYLTTESAFAFTIDSISLPIDTASTGQEATTTSLSLSLGVYYYE